MRKYAILLVSFLISVMAVGQISVKQVAFGAKGVDSISGATTKYYYLNGSTYGTVKAKAYNTDQVYAVQVMVAHPLVYTASDSVHIWLELSCDNSNWVKWTNGGATTAAGIAATTHTQVPIMIGSNAAYLYAGDFAVTTSTDAGVIFLPKSMYAPYMRIACQRYKASSASYVTAWVSLVK